ncbi:MAG: competence/damage-inducible protein A [Desulfobacca sp.]|nr:competence/damage-inducible protein A [Desulfobacca sp.]
MHGEIIATGTELISGRVADTNSPYAAARLHDAGLILQCVTILGDEVARFQETLRQGLQRSQFIIITGGLGPTEDDITVAAAAQTLNLPLRLDDYLLRRIKDCLQVRGLPWEERYARLALVPEGALILDPGGAACGFSLKYENTWLYFLPGVPEQMQMLFDLFVLPPLLSLSSGGQSVCQRTLRMFGLTETQLEVLLDKVCKDNPMVSVGLYPNFPENHLCLTMRGPEPRVLEATLDRLTQDLADAAGDALLGTDAVTLEELVGQSLRAQHLTLAVAESCSGGLISHRLTNVPGASDYFMGGVVTYSNQAKMELLQVSPATLDQHGAVSAQTARAMALGVKELFHTPVALAVTGIAGPSGGSPEKPVGTVYLGLAKSDQVQTRHCQFHGNREQIKTLTAQTALDWLRRELQHDSRLSGH